MQAQYRNYPQTTQRSPHTQGRRGPGPMAAAANIIPQQAPPTNYQSRQDPAGSERKRKSNKPTDKNIPEGVESIAIDGGAVERYRKLRDIERRLDATVMRKRLDIEDGINRNQARHRTFRVWVSNTAENQPWQENGGMDPESFDFNSESQATYRVKIEGRVLWEKDDPEYEEAAEGEENGENDGDTMEQDGDEATKKAEATKSPVSHQRTKLSHFFKAIQIDFDRSKSLQPDGFTQIEWKRPDPPAPNQSNTTAEANFDTLEFERKGDENINITIKFVRDDTPERFRIKEPLAELLDTDEGERAGVMMGVWAYAKAKNLQEDEENRKIVCDERLKRIFNAETLFLPDLPRSIMPLLEPLPPYSLPYTIRVDKEYITSPTPTVYDLHIRLHDPFRPLIAPIVAPKPVPDQTLQTLANLDDQLALLIQAMTHSRAKHAFFTALAKDPVGFVKRWIASQRRDLEVIMGEATRGGGGEDGGAVGEEWRYGGESGVWGGEGAREAVGLWLARGGKAH